MPDEYAIVRAISVEQLTDLIMNSCDAMLEKHEQDQQMQDPVAQAKAYILAHYAEDISLVDLCDEALHVTPAYFSRLFHEKTGTTYIDYLNSIRLNNSAELLANTQIPVADIADRVGFRDQKYFTRRFKARFSCTPSEYRDHGGKI